MADHFVRIRLVHYEVRFFTLRCPAAREAGHGEIEGPPKEMHGARLAEEATAKLLEHRVGLNEDLEEALDRCWVVRRMLLVVGETDRPWHFDGHGGDFRFDIQLTERIPDFTVEGGHRSRNQRNRLEGSVRRGDPELVIQEVEQ